MDDYKNSKEGKLVAQKYADILYADRPQTEQSLRKHPRMSLYNRAKIFSPFAALRGYEERIAAEGEKHRRIPRPELSDEQAALLNENLSSLQKGMGLRVVFFQPVNDCPQTLPIGTCQEVVGTLERFEPAYRRLRVNGVEILIDDLLEVQPLPKEEYGEWPVAMG